LSGTRSFDAGSPVPFFDFFLAGGAMLQRKTYETTKRTNSKNVGAFWIWISISRGTLRLQRCELLECRSNVLHPRSSPAELRNSACGTGCSAQQINENTPAAQRQA
jgi:hypothetical protein